MAKFEVQPGEQVMERVQFGMLTRKRGPRQLIVTDRRLVVVDSISLWSVVLFGWLTALVSAARRNNRMHYELSRGSLEQVELVGKRGLVLHTQARATPRNTSRSTHRGCRALEGSAQVWNAGTAGAAQLSARAIVP